MDIEVKDAFPKKGSASSGIGRAHVAVMIGQNWIDGCLKMKVEWKMEQSSCEELLDMKEDYSQMTARHLVDVKVTITLWQLMETECKRGKKRLSRIFHEWLREW